MISCKDSYNTESNPQGMKDYIEFQDRAFPLAYLITIRCYGTWLHGDERYSVDRSKFNIYEKPKLPPRAGLKNKEFSALKTKPVALDKMARKIVEGAIKEVCKFREYVLLAINIRSNHAHMVVTAKSEPELLMNSFKAYATRSLRKESFSVPMSEFGQGMEARGIFGKKNISNPRSITSYMGKVKSRNLYNNI